MESMQRCDLFIEESSSLQETKPINPFIIGKSTLYLSDCIDVLREFPDNSIEACLTDPPYGLSSHSEDDIRKCITAWLKDESYVHGGKGFMGKSWDSFVPGPEMWKELFRVLKPGAHLLVFAGTRTADLMSLALRLAGFECRETLMWCFGSGFPKAADIGKHLDKMAGAEREVVDVVKKKPSSSSDCHEGWVRPWAEGKTTMDITAPATPEAAQWDGWKSALKPAYEPILLFRKPLDGTIAANTLKWRCGGLNIDACRVGIRDKNESGWSKTGSKASENRSMSGANYSRDPKDEFGIGRYPANIILSSDDEVEKCFPVITGSVSRFFQHCDYTLEEIAELNGIEPKRIIYSSKASKTDRNEGCDDLLERESSSTSNGGKPGKVMTIGGASLDSKPKQLNKVRNHHPTVKPTSLLRYLLKLIVPPGATVIDPFLGSGSTCKAALLEGFNVIGIEREQEYFEIAKARISYVSPSLFEDADS